MNLIAYPFSQDSTQCGQVYHYIGDVKFFDELPRYIKDGIVIKVLYRGNIGDKELYPLNRYYIRTEGRWQELHTDIDFTPYSVDINLEREEDI